MKRWKLLVAISVIVAGILVGVSSFQSSGGLLAEAGSRYELPIMKPDPDTIRKWMELYNKAPQAYINSEIEARIAQSPGESFSLLDHLEYDPADNQGSCGNCWVWAGTRALGIALDVQEGIKDRLSVQYFTSCYEGGGGESWACCGGWLDWFADWYEDNRFAIPWSNTNAYWQDGGQTCCEEHNPDRTCKTYGETTIPCDDISTACRYPISDTSVAKNGTRGVGQETAIANIKNVLRQNKAIWFVYYLATEDDWDDFRDFWRNEPEEAIWNPDYSCGHTWDEEGGGAHAVLIVGYDDTDPDNSYWTVLNSWGTTADRPNGLFRLDMDMNYDCNYLFDGQETQSFFWQTLDVDFHITPISKGLCWLSEHQNPNGSWTYSGRITEENVGLTSIATLAFLNHGVAGSDPTVSKAIEWILSKQNANGSITQGGYQVYDTSFAILALAATRNANYYDEIQSATNFLIDLQNDGGEGYSQSDKYYGGWPYWEGMDDWADLSNSQFVMLALWYAEGFNPGDTIVPADVWDKAETFVTRCQNREASNPDYDFYDDGGFIYMPGSTTWAGGRSYASMTAAGLWGFFTSGVSEGDGRVQDAWGWIQNNYYVDQNYPLANQFLYYYLYGLAKAGVLWGVDEINGHDWYQEMSEALIDNQQADGHWPGTEPNEEPDNVATCWALLALESKQIAPGAGLHIEVHSPVDLHLYDPKGRHVGINYETGEVEIGIPGATYSGPETEPQTIEVPDPIAGGYRTKLVGRQKGDFTLTIEGTVDTTTVYSRSFMGSIEKGETKVLDFVVSALAGPITIDTEGKILSISELQLDSNWNLNSFNVEPAETTISTVLAPISGQYLVVLGFDGEGLTYDPNVPDKFNTLREMNPYHGYWIKTTVTTTLPVIGNLMPVTTPLPLAEGWNLVSYLPRDPLSVPDALASIAGRYTTVLGYDRGATSFYTTIPPQLNTLNTMEPDKGYWIKMTEPGMLIYPGVSAVGAAVLPVNQPQAPTGVIPTNEWINVYSLNSTYNDQSLPIGAVVTAVGEDGRKLGEVAVREAGWYGVLSIYRDDPYTPELDGAHRGERIGFLINGQPATITNGVDPVWTSHGDLIEIDLAASSPDVSRHSIFLPLTTR